MTLAKRLSISFAAVAAAITVGALGSDPAQAMIVKGSVTGTWDTSVGQGANVNAGDKFVADYSYDDDTLTPFDYSQPGFFKRSGYSGYLLSLIVNSGNYSHNFDFSAGGYSQISFDDFIGESISFPYSQKTFSFSGYDFTPGFNEFDASKQTREDSNGATNTLLAELVTSDYNTGDYSDFVTASSDVKFTPDPTSDPTAVPTPALLPGLIGLGVGVLRKRKVEAAQLTSEV